MIPLFYQNWLADTNPLLSGLLREECAAIFLFEQWLAMANPEDV